MARPSKRTPEREARLLQALASGNTRRAACAHAGISDETFSTWCKRYLDFLEAVQKAEAAAEVRAVATIIRASDKQWQAAAWWLERRRPVDFARQEKIDSKIELSGSANVFTLRIDRGNEDA